jgi:uncharacterized protein
MNNVSRLQAIIRDDALRWRLLGLVRALRLPDCWIGAGFVRNTVWDSLHGRAAAAPTGDVDVLWFDPAQADAAVDQAIEARLRWADPSMPWSVRNQARMHGRNGDAPYASVTDAMRFWPETATAVAVRRSARDDCTVAAPYGLDDLFGLVLRPGPAFRREKRHICHERVRMKGWLTTWPRLQVAGCPVQPD